MGLHEMLKVTATQNKTISCKMYNGFALVREFYNSIE